MILINFCKQDKGGNTLQHTPRLSTGIPSLHLIQKENKSIEEIKLNILRVKKQNSFVIKESVGGENKVSNVIEKLILKDIKNNLRDKKEDIHYDDN